jgi:two-component system, cell cycle sensor histidine kinase and response regulator CckA
MKRPLRILAPAGVPQPTTAKPGGSTSADDLRRRAEETAAQRAPEKPHNLGVLQPAMTRQLLHELQVHQIELEMQNEELRLAQEALGASQAQYFDLFDLAPVGYLTLSEQGLILEANLAASKLLGLARGALVRQPLSRFVVSEDQDSYYRHRKRLLEGGAPQACELRLAKKDGVLLWVQLEAIVTQDADGSSICRTVVSDIGERKRVDAEQARLEEQRRQLRKAESLGRVAGAMAHHFDNLVQAVIGNLELAMRDWTRDGGPVKHLTAAMEAANRAGEIIGLTLTHLGQTFASHGPLRLCDACRRTLALLQVVVPKDVVLEADLPSPGPTIDANANQVQQVLTSLVTNAWEAYHSGRGVIRVSVRTVFAADVPEAHRFPADWQPQESAYACLEVADSGCGIAARQIERIFDPFFSSKFVGRGLGLAVVLGMVRAHRAVLTVESEAGRDSVFRVFWPAATDPVLRPIESQHEW